DGRQVGVVRLDVGVARLAELFGGEGVHGADVGTGLGEGVAGYMVVAAGALDGDHEVPEVVGRLGAAEVGQGGSGLDALLGHLGGGHQDVAVKVAEHPLEARLGTIDGDDAEVLRPDRLHAGMDDAAGLLQEGWTRGGGASAGTFAWHGSHLRGKGKDVSQFSSMAAGKSSFISLIYIPGDLPDCFPPGEAGLFGK